MIYIIIIALILLIIYLSTYNVENFELQLQIPLVDDYSLKLHDEITKREETWRLAHNKKLYYYDYVEPQHFKD